jgi:DNA invertase Pin-like site-specific DNA recombinase
MTGRYVSYLRVSTTRQGVSGLGIEAQRRAVEAFLNCNRWELVAEFVEVESGKKDDRPKLEQALALCRLYKATLVIAKLDRLSRDAHFLLGLQKAEVKFVAADMPEANEMVVGILAVVAQAERRMIAERTRAALAAAKARGQRIGRVENLKNAEEGQARGRATRTARAAARARELAPVIEEVRRAGATSSDRIAEELTRRGIPAARGRSWSAVQVRRVVDLRGPKSI